MVKTKQTFQPQAIISANCWHTHLVSILMSILCHMIGQENASKSVEAAEGRTAHSNGWNGVNVMLSTNVIDTIPLTPIQPFSPQ